jgi:hypothetical protein
MANNSSAHSAKAGFNQSGGAYFIVITDISAKLFSYTPGTFSGGATTPGTVTDVTGAKLAPGTTPITLTAGKLIKDMGKSVVVPTVGANSVNVTYRKFQAVVAPSADKAGGQAGKAPEYVSFYLEVGREGAANVSPAGIARYF